MNNYYYQRYVKLIKHYQKLNLSKNSETYTESHHIIPRSVGGDNSSYNLVRLPFKAHVLAHWMLHKAYADDAALAQSFAMTVLFGREKSRVSSRMVKRAETACSKARTGTKHTPETIAKITAANTGKTLSLECKAKIGEAHTGKKHTLETKAKISKTRTSRGINPVVHPFVNDITGEERRCTQYALRTEFSLNQSKLSGVCRGIRPHHKGWRIKSV